MPWSPRNETLAAVLCLSEDKQGGGSAGVTEKRCRQSREVAINMRGEGLSN